jgi:NDP-sugar pyrophosphorylase family protein
MSVGSYFKDTDVIFLCGGLGERLRGVIKDRPKAMALIDGRPFLDILIEYVSGFGLKRFILCIGYLGDFIKQHYQDAKYPGEIIFSQESEPLGTAGAIKNAEPFIRSPSFFVMNADSFCRVDLLEFFDFHLAKSALASLVLVNADDTKDFGAVSLDGAQQIIGFSEKPVTQNGNLVNAGVCLLRRETLSLIPANSKFSLEKDFFPMVIGRGFYGFIEKSGFIDIGTPQRYNQAKGGLGLQ